MTKAVSQERTQLKNERRYGDDPTDDGLNALWIKLFLFFKNERLAATDNGILIGCIS
jgi:hypothetical protein